jgi:hypothetical protein
MSTLSGLIPTVEGAKGRYVRGEIDEEELEEQIERALTRDRDTRTIADNAIALSVCAIAANKVLEAADE